jgi:hypothetical protein
MVGRVGLTQQWRPDSRAAADTDSVHGWDNK